MGQLFRSIGLGRDGSPSRPPAALSAFTARPQSHSIGRRARRALPTFLVLLFTLSVQAEIRLSNLFTDNMVLQREVEIPVFGTGDTDGEKVTVEFNGQSVSATVKNGEWKAVLASMPASSTPQQLTIQSVIGNQQSAITNVLLGDVWLAGGQSNMDYDIQKYLALDKHPEVAAQYQQFVDEGGNFPNLRMVLLEKKTDSTPQKSMPSIDGWLVGSPERVPKMSATGYVFARKLHEHLQIPIGLIDCNKGGSRAEVWMADGRKSYHNGMLAPMFQLPVKGIIWYQGESNAKNVANAMVYEETLKAMIGDWRTGWGFDMPFLVVQLAAYDKKPGNNVCYPILREAQMKATELPDVGIVTAIDLGEKLNIHPCFKIPLSERLVGEARAIAYGESLVYRGATFKSMEIDGNRAIIAFDHIGSGLEARTVQLDTYNVSGEKLEGFEMCGKDGSFLPANALIESDKVIVSHPDIPEPVHVRYAWAGFPLCNLYNKEGLPAFPFRTDDFVPDEVELPEPAPKPKKAVFDPDAAKPFIGTWVFTHKEQQYSREFTTDGFCIHRNLTKDTEDWKVTYTVIDPQTAVASKGRAGSMHKLIADGSLDIQGKWTAERAAE